MRQMKCSEDRQNPGKSEDSRGIHICYKFFSSSKITNRVNSLSSLVGDILRWQMIFTGAIMHQTPVVSPIILWFTWENMKTACLLWYTDHPYLKRGRKILLYSSEDLHISNTHENKTKFVLRQDWRFVPVNHFKHKDIL